MRPVSVFAKGPAGEIEQLEAGLHGRWRQATRAVMVLLSLHGLPPAQIAALLGCHPATVRRWISRFNDEGQAGLADRPRCGRPRLGGRQLTGRIAALLARPHPRCIHATVLAKLSYHLSWRNTGPDGYPQSKSSGSGEYLRLLVKYHHATGTAPVTFTPDSGRYRGKAGGNQKHSGIEMGAAACPWH
jgi:hypothetical protein